MRGELVQVQPVNLTWTTPARQQTAVTETPETAMATFAVERATLAAHEPSETVEIGLPFFCSCSDSTVFWHLHPSDQKNMAPKGPSFNQIL